MKSIVKILPLVLVTAACGGGSDDGGDEGAISNDYVGAIMDAEDGTATLTLAGETYDLDVDICPTANGSMSTETEQVAMVTGMASKQDDSVMLNLHGLKSSRGDQTKEEASFTITAKDGIVEGGATYRGEMPYSVFQGSGASFKGVAQDPSRAATANVDVPVEFSINCG